MGKKYKIICLFIGLVLFALFPCTVQASDREAGFDSSGNFIYTTTDGKAASAIYWRNNGFIINIEKRYGNSVQGKHVTIAYDGENASHTVIDMGNGFKHTTYRIKGSYLQKRFNQEYGEGYYENKLKDGQVIYFNNIFQVTLNGGKTWSKNIYTFDEIGSYPWKAGNSQFWQHFDIPYTFMKIPLKSYPAKSVCQVSKAGKWISVPGTGKDLGSGIKGSSKTAVFDKNLTYENKRYEIYHSFTETLSEPTGTTQKEDEQIITDGTPPGKVCRVQGKIRDGGTRFTARYRLCEQYPVISVCQIMKNGKWTNLPEMQKNLGKGQEGDSTSAVFEQSISIAGKKYKISQSWYQQLETGYPISKYNLKTLSLGDSAYAVSKNGGKVLKGGTCFVCRYEQYTEDGLEPVVQDSIVRDGTDWISVDRIALGRKKKGTKITAEFKSYVKYRGKKYKPEQSWYEAIDSKKGGNGKFNEKQIPLQTPQQICKSGGTVLEGGTRFICCYTLEADNDSFGKDEEYTDNVMKGDLYGPEALAVIKADTRGDEQFDAEQAVPATEMLYVNVLAKEYLSEYQYSKKIIKRMIPCTVTVNGSTRWTTQEPNPPDKDGIVKGTHSVSHSGTYSVAVTINVERLASYWAVDKYDIFELQNAEIQNYALPDGKIKLNPTGYSGPKVQYKETEQHIFLPENNSFSIKGPGFSGGDSPPSVTTGMVKKIAADKAENSLGQIKVRNDLFEFNGNILMDNRTYEKNAASPLGIPKSSKNIGENILYENNLMIGQEKKNGKADSEGIIRYNRISSKNSSNNPIQEFSINGINPVIIHTPTVCEGRIENNKKDNQMVSPDTSSMALVLDRPFSIYIPTKGKHLDTAGYQYRDYAKYMSKRQVCFPFDVYTDNKKYMKAGTWYTLQGIHAEFYLPSWVEEGKYTIRYRCIAVNADGNEGTEKTEKAANLDRNHYTAVNTSKAEISGRMYGLHLYDISDYPIWQNVFRKPDSLQLSNFMYPLGDKDQNGIPTRQNQKYTIPLVCGSHPFKKDAGIIPAGYVVRFALSTVGGFSSPNDSIHIVPKFYYIDKNGKNRQEIDLYYSETFEDKKQSLVKVGSVQDKRNVKFLRTGDPYLALPKEELNITSKLMQQNLLSWKNQNKKVYTFSDLLITEHLRTFTGKNSYMQGSIPAGIGKDKVLKSMQNWYCEYYLPGEIHVLPKNFPFKQYVQEHGSVNYTEPIWLKDGYIIVNFNIMALKNGKEYLSYCNQKNEKAGYCNMWKREGYQYVKKDSSGIALQWEDGDFILYDTNKSATKDYVSGGTH